MKKLFYAAALTVATGAIHAQCVMPNLIAHWNFDGPTATTELINGWTPMPGSGGTPTAGENGVANTAWHFNGTSDYLEYAGNSILSLTSWTITALVRPDGFWPNICQGNSILWHGEEYGPTFYSLIFYDNSYDACVGHSPECSYFDPANEVFAGGAAGSIAFSEKDWSCSSIANPYIVPKKWYCVAIMYDGTTGTMSLYVNGVLTVLETGGWPNQYSYGGPLDNLFIGSSNTPTGTYAYLLNGDIDDLKIYDGPICPSYANNPGYWEQACADAADGYKRSNATTVATTSNSNKITITPNPASSSISITSPAPSADQKGSISITNELGQIVLQGNVDPSGVTGINISAFAKGIYFVKVSVNNFTSTQKVVKD